MVSARVISVEPATRKASRVSTVARATGAMTIAVASRKYGRPTVSGHSDRVNSVMDRE